MTAKIVLSIGQDATHLSVSGTFTCIMHSNKNLSILIVLCGKNIYIVDVDSKLPCPKEGKVFDFEPHKWYLSGSEADLIMKYGSSCHVLNTGDSIFIPRDAPHCVHSLQSTIGLINCIEETLSSNYWLLESQISQQPAITNNHIPVPVSHEHFGSSLRENLKLGPSAEQPAL